MPLINTADRHEVTVKSAVFGESQTGTPFVELAFENATGDSINGWLYLSTAAFERSVYVLRDVFGFDNNFDTLVGQVVGKKCAVVTEFETFDGKERLKVKWINSLHSVIPIKDGGAISKFSAMAARIPGVAPKAAKVKVKAESDFPTA